MSKPQSDLFLKFMSALVTAAALKMSIDLGEIKTTVALAVQRIEQQELRIHELEVGAKDLDARIKKL